MRTSLETYWRAYNATNIQTVNWLQMNEARLWQYTLNHYRLTHSFMGFLILFFFFFSSSLHFPLFPVFSRLIDRGLPIATRTTRACTPVYTCTYVYVCMYACVWDCQWCAYCSAVYGGWVDTRGKGWFFFLCYEASGPFEQLESVVWVLGRRFRGCGSDLGVSQTRALRLLGLYFDDVTIDGTVIILG